MKIQKIRIAVVLCSDGDYSAQGWANRLQDPVKAHDKRMMESCHECVDGPRPTEFWIEVDLPVPEPQTFVATILPKEIP